MSNDQLKASGLKQSGLQETMSRFENTQTNPMTQSRIKEQYFKQTDNAQRQEFFEKYQSIFKNTDLYNSSVFPMLLAKPVLMRKIEEIYEEQFRRLLKKKSLLALNLPAVIEALYTDKQSKTQMYS